MLIDKGELWNNMRLIDADRLITRLRKDPLFCLVEPYGIIGVIEAEHTVDAVPVVRCKDCIYYHPFAEIKGKGECHIVEDTEYFPWYEDCDYCSYGERRDGDGC